MAVFLPWLLPWRWIRRGRGWLVLAAWLFWWFSGCLAISNATWSFAAKTPRHGYPTAVKAQEHELDQLHERLSNDDNPQTQAFLADLRRCTGLVDELREQLQGDSVSQAILTDLEALLSAGLHALRTLANLWDEINALTTYEAQAPSGKDVANW